MQSDSSNLVCALDFANLPVHTKKEPYLIDFCNPVDVKSECLKYLSDARDLPLSQESQLMFLLNNLKLEDIQMAFIKLITIVGGAATTAFCPMPYESKVSGRLPMLDLRSQIYDDRYR